MVEHRLEQDGGAEVIGANVARDLVHALAHAHLGGEVDDTVATLERGAQAVGVAHVTAHHLGPFGKLQLRRAVDLIDQGVVEADLMAMGKQLPCDMTADEAAAAGNQYLRH